MATSGSTICLVAAYPPQERRLGGGGWVDRRLTDALLAAEFEVDLMSVTGTERVWNLAGITGRSAAGIPLEIRSDPRRLARITVRMMLTGEPYLASKFTAFGAGWREAIALIRERAGGGRVVTSGWPALLLADAASVPVAAHLAHNVETTIARAHAPRALRALGEVRRLDRAERRLLAAPETRLAISRHDARTFTALGLPTAHLALPLRQVAPPRPRQRHAVGFIGKAGWPPNAQTLRTLLGPVHEQLLRRDADVEFVLAGTGTERYAGHPRVTRSGWIEEEVEFYRQVGVVVVPRFGPSTGISVKMLEATEHGVAAIVPRELAEAVDPGGPWIIAHDAASTAEAILDWIRDPRLGDPTAYLARQARDSEPSALLRALRR